MVHGAKDAELQAEFIRRFHYITYMQLYRFNQNVRSVSFVPGLIVLVLIGGLSLQIGWHKQTVNRAPEIHKLPPPPGENTVRLFFIDENIAASRLLMLWLQAFDNQPGVSLSFKQLDYDHLTDWLELILSLDPASDYPLLSASRIYTGVADDNKKRKMLEFVQRQFLDNPARRWQWMAHAVLIAKHGLKDLEYAAQIANMLRENTDQQTAPDWARQMEIFILEDLGELESAKVLIGGLLESGELNDPHQYNFLTQKLKEIEALQQ